MDLTPLDPSKLRCEISIDPVIVQNIGVRIAPVMQGPLQQRIRTVGTVTYNETSVRDINTKIGGWIETLYVNAEGEPVERDEPLFSIYSPELYQAQEEYLLAWRTRQERGAPPPGRAGIDLLESARTRLEYFDISDEQIRALEEAGKPQKSLTIVSPYKGIVIEKRATEGMRIEPGMAVYRVADLSTVWVQTTLYEHQLPLVDVGQEATMTLPFLPGETFNGRAAYVYPYLNEQARQARVRLEFENPAGTLKPGMYATVEIETPIEDDVVLAPREAVITTGERRVAFVSLGDGRFEPREVRTGLSVGGKVQILDGLETGEMVVTSGQFLLDSESRMREALAKMVTGEMASEQRPDVAVAEADQSASLPPEGQAALADLLQEYVAIGEILANDTSSGISERAAAMTRQMETMTAAAPPGDPHFWHQRQEDLATLRERSAQLSKAVNIEAARNAYGHLSDALDRIVAATGVPPALGMAIDRRVCGMAPDVPRKGVWLQPADDDVRNPYFGSMMLRCNVPDQHRRLPMMDVEEPQP